MVELKLVFMAGVGAWVGLFLCPDNAYAGNDIGIIKGNQGCPAGAQEIEFLLDNEDSDNRNQPTGWVGDIEQGGNTHLRFCRVDGDAFFSVGPRGTFAVLSLAQECPANTLRFFRSIDDEDRNNANRVRRWPDQPRSIEPNVSNKYNTKLAFCLNYYEGPGFAGSFQRFSVEYGVFATFDTLRDPNTAYGDVFMDDENRDNADRFTYDWTSNPYEVYATIARTIIEPEGPKRSEVCFSPYNCTRPGLNGGQLPCDVIDTSCSCDVECEEQETLLEGKDTRLHIALIY